MKVFPKLSELKRKTMKIMTNLFFTNLDILKFQSELQPTLVQD